MSDKRRSMNRCCIGRRPLCGTAHWDWPRFILFVFALCFQTILPGQNQVPILWFQSIQGREFSKNFNYHVHHDSEGFVWVSSYTGLNRYDGARVKRYRSVTGDSTTLFGENIHSKFFEDKRGDLWFSTFEAIHVYKRKTDNFRHFFVNDENGVKIQESYRVFFLEKDSFLWLKAGDGVYRYHIHSGESDLVLPNTPIKQFAVGVDSLGAVAHLFPIGALEKNGQSFYRVENGRLTGGLPWCDKSCQGPMPKKITNIIAGKDGQHWVSTDTGLYRWRPTARQWELISQKWQKECTIEKWGDRYLVVLFNGTGLKLFDKDLNVFTALEARFVHEKTHVQHFEYLYVDRSDNLWISHKSNGLSYANLKKTKFYSYPKQPAINGNTGYSYWTMLEDTDQRVWYGTNTDGVFALDRLGRAKQYDLAQGQTSDIELRKNWVTDLTLDAENRLWASSRGGLFYFDKTKEAFRLVPDTNNPLDIVHLYHHLDHGLFVLTTNQGILKLRKNKQNGYSLDRVLKADEPFTSLFIAHNHYAFLCRNDSQLDVFQINKDSFHFVKSLPVKGNVSGYALSENGRHLWVGSIFGLAKIDLDSLAVSKVFHEGNGLSDKAILGILPEKNGQIWLSTTKGMSLFSPDKAASQTYSLADGIQSSEFYLYACLLRANGEQWFAGTEGITVIPANGLPAPVLTKPQTRVTNIRINDLTVPLPPCKQTGATNVTEMEHLVLQPDQNTVSFEFVAIEYSDPGNNQLRFFLENVDKDTVTLAKGEPGFARYPNLPPGTYTFTIQGANSDGVWDEPHRAIRVTVLPRWHQKTWVRALGMLLLLGLCYLGFRYKQIEVKEKEALKTRISENKMEALRSQMNPHFVFNSLQTVNGFITRQDLRGAIQYVNQFAKLMRMILENSRAGMISLEKEIELLELYMQIEAKRFSNPFTYTINVGNNLDTFEAKVPSMMLQPFVENAIKHGLFHKKEAGHITVGFHRENGHLKCYVEDNGVGRERSARLNEQEGRAHVSRGLQIVRERLDLIRKSSPGDYDIRIIDLHDLKDEPSGTRVEVRLPFSV